MTKDRSLSTAIHILSSLAYRHPELMSSEDLALSLKTNPGLVRRVLSKLKEAGLVKTSLGKSGGSTLNMPASKITLDKIYLAVNDGPLFGAFDKDPYGPCPVSCKMNNILTDTYSSLEEELLLKMKKRTLSEIVEQI